MPAKGEARLGAVGLLLAVVVVLLAPAITFGAPGTAVTAAEPTEPLCGEGTAGDAFRPLQTAWWWLWLSQGPLVASDAPSPYHIVVNTYENTLTLFHEGRQIRQYPVAVGKGSTPTPPGEWVVTNQSRNWGGGFGTRWNGINVPWGIYGIHGTNQPHAIGSHVSAGCIRMFNQDVEQLYDTIPTGTTVTIYGPLPRVAARPEISGGSGKFMLVAQLRLRQAGFDPGPIDGRFGARTQTAIKNFNGFYGLPPDAVLTRPGQELIYFPR